MAKSLIHEEGLAGVDRRLAELFRVARGAEVDPFRKRRVLVRLERTQRGSSPRFWLRRALVAALLVSGTAAAAVGHRFVSNSPGFFGFGPAQDTSRLDSAASARHKRPRVCVDSPPPSLVEPSRDTPEQPEPQTPAVASAAKRGASRPSASDDPARVVEAILALRTQGEASRAQNLLDEYLNTYPHGLLSEEALALSIEAASTHHAANTADYARRYLATFPHGKYRQLASRALEPHSLPSPRTGGP